MPTTTTRGFRVPLDSDPVNDGAEATRNLGQDVNDKVGVFASGSIVINLAAAATGSAAIAFPAGRFSATPRIVATLRTSTTYVPSVTAASAAGATVNVRHVDSTAATTALTVDWIAHLS